MLSKNTEFCISTSGKGFYPFEDKVSRWLKECGVKEGQLVLWCRHTTASLVVQENYDPELKADIDDFFEELVPEKRKYRHCLEGPDDAPAHIRSTLMNVQLTIPVMNGKMALGTWQGLYLFEHRRHADTRRVVASFIGQ